MLLGIRLTSTPRRSVPLLVLACVVASSLILALILFACGNLGDRNDFRSELWPAYKHLYDGHILGFLGATPSYVGAAIWRAPLALIAMSLHAGWRLTFWITAIPCFAALPIFGVWFTVRSGAGASDRSKMLLAFTLVAIFDPVIWYAGLLGHPEEMVGIVLVISAVLTASEGRLWLAMFLMTAGVSNKPGLAEAVPVMAAALPGRYARTALALVLAGLLAYSLYNLTPLSSWIHIRELTNGTDVDIGPFLPFQLLWWFGAGSWLAQHEHVFVAPLCAAVAALWWHFSAKRTLSAAQRSHELLWLLSFIFLIRTSIEPWDNVYYNLPLICGLLCCQAGRVPWAAISSSAGALLFVPTNRLIPAPPEVQAVLYGIVDLPLLVLLGFRVFGVSCPGNLARLSPLARAFASTDL